MIERRGRRVRLDRRFLAEPTAAGEPPLVHGYAITGHVAQGVTVDHAFVLASEGIDREWAYVALSRGRQSNRLYLAAACRRRPRRVRARQPADDRSDQAPRPPARVQQRAGPRDRHRPASRTRPGRRFRGSARASHRRAARLEGRSLGWLPGRRRELEAAREREADARRARLEASTRRPAHRRRTGLRRQRRTRSCPPDRASDRTRPAARPRDRTRAVSARPIFPTHAGRRDLSYGRDTQRASAGAEALAAALIELLASSPAAMARLLELLEGQRPTRAGPSDPGLHRDLARLVLHVSPKVVRGAITRGELYAVKRGSRWIISAEAVLRWAQLDQTPRPAVDAGGVLRSIARSARRSLSFRGRIAPSGRYDLL